MKFVKIKMGIKTLMFVMFLLLIKFLIHAWGMELLSLNALFTSAIAGAVFIIGFLLAGIIADYKEADRTPAELRSSLESIWEEGVFLYKVNKNFDIKKLKKFLVEIIINFFKGLGHEGGHFQFEPCIDSINRLSYSFAQMEQLGVPPNYIVRLKTEQSYVRRIVLRVLHIQRTQFLPSVHTLSDSLIAGVVLLLLLVQTEGSPESFILFGFLAYLFIYIRHLIRALEKPFRQQDDTIDDVSLYLLHDFEKKLKVKQGN